MAPPRWASPAGSPNPAPASPARIGAVAYRIPAARPTSPPRKGRRQVAQIFSGKCSLPWLMRSPAASGRWPAAAPRCRAAGCRARAVRRGVVRAPRMCGALTRGAAVGRDGTRGGLCFRSLPGLRGQFLARPRLPPLRCGVAEAPTKTAFSPSGARPLSTASTAPWQSRRDCARPGPREFHEFETILGAPALDCRGPALGWWRAQSRQPDPITLTRQHGRPHARRHEGLTPLSGTPRTPVGIARHLSSPRSDKVRFRRLNRPDPPSTSRPLSSVPPGGTDTAPLIRGRTLPHKASRS